MYKNIISGIDESKDIHPGVNDWNFLVAPFIDALKLNPKKDKIPLIYVDTESNMNAITYRIYSKKPILDLSNDKDSLLKNQSRLLGPSEETKPTSIIGEPGTGKSTWTRNFFQHGLKSLLKEEEYSYYIYDHNDYKGALIGADDITLRIRQVILFEVIKLLQKTNKKLQVSDAINSIDLDEIKASELTEKLTIGDKIQHTVKNLKLQGHIVWVVIDNLDRYSSDQQQEGIEIANYLSRICGIHTVVPLRPYVYSGFIQHLDGRVVLLPSPDLKALMSKRIEYIRDHSQDISSFLDLCEQIKESRLDLTWCDGRVSNRDDVLTLYNKIIDTIGFNGTLLNMVACLRNNNIRKGLDDIANLLSCGYFSDAMVSCIKNNRRSIDENTIVTSFLRGPYQRYRGDSPKYKIDIVNLFDLNCISPDSTEKLIGFRILQIMHGYTSPDHLEGIKYADLRERLMKFGYSSPNINAVVTLFLRRRILKEINNCKNWLHKTTSIEESDELIISSAGVFYVNNFLKEFALRYCEAMSNVARFPISLFKSNIKTSTGIYDICNNSYYLLREHLKILIKEITSLTKQKESDGATKYDLLCRETSHGGSFFVDAVSCCHKLVKIHYEANKSEHYRNWDVLMNKWGQLKHDTQAALTSKDN